MPEQIDDVSTGEPPLLAQVGPPPAAQHARHAWRAVPHDCLKLRNSPFAFFVHALRTSFETAWLQSAFDDWKSDFEPAMQLRFAEPHA